MREATADGPLFLPLVGQWALLRQAVEKSVASGLFRGHAELALTTGFRNVLMSKFRQIQLAGQDPEFSTSADADPDVLETFQEYTRLLDRADGVDSTAGALWAVDQLRQPDHPLYERFGAWVVVDPVHLGRLEWRAISALQRGARDLVIWTPANDAHRPALNEGLARVERRLERGKFVVGDVGPDACPPAPAIAALADRLFAEDGPPPLESVNGLAIWGVPQGEGEARAVASAVRDKLRLGARPDEVIVAYPGSGDLPNRIAETLRAWSIPVRWVRDERLSTRSAVKLLMRALRIVATDWETAQVVALLRQGGFAPPWEEVGETSSLLRAARGLKALQVYRGRANLTEQVRVALSSPSKAENPRSAERVENLLAARAVLGRLAAVLGPLESDHTWPEFAAVLERTAEGLGLFASQDPALDRLFQSLEERTDARQRAGLIEPGEWNLREFLAEVEQLTTEVTTPAEPGQGVELVPARRAIGYQVPHLVIAGLGEGTFPDRDILLTPPHLHDELPNDDLFEQVSRRWIDSVALAGEMRRFVGLLRGADQSVTLIYPAASDDGERMLPASFLDEVTRALAPPALAIVSTESTWLSADLPGPLVGSAHDVRRAAIAQALRDPGALPALEQLAREPEHRAAFRSIGVGMRCNQLRLSSRRFGPFDGRLRDTRTLEAIDRRILSGRSLSISELETYAMCPFKYFASRVLKVGSEPELDDLAIDLAWAGQGIHAILEALHTRDGQFVARPCAEDLDLALQQWAEKQPPARSDLEHGLMRLKQAHIRKVAAAYLEQAAKYASDSPNAQPIAVEIAFGMPGDRYPALEVDLGVEGRIHLAGRIDRIDRDLRGSEPVLRIIDYKTGGVPTASQLNRGMALQLPLYLRAASELGLQEQNLPTGDAGYWGITRNGFRIAFPLKSQKGADPAEAWETLFEQLSVFLAEVVRRMRGGDFTVSPRIDSCESRCEFSSTCRIRQLNGMYRPKVHEVPFPVLIPEADPQ